MIDIHCHMLPAVDDGAQSLEEALALARACAADGIRHVVLTPHVFPGRFDNLRSSIAQQFAQFTALPEVLQLPLSFSWAGEVRLAAEALALLDSDELPFLGQSDGMHNLLLEMPDGQVPLGAETLVARLLGRGIRPVIVHPERNRGVMSKPERIRPFVEAGCLLQVTAGSLVGQFGERANAVARTLLDQGWVSAVASDSHNLKGRRPLMRAARRALVADYGPAAAFALLAGTPAALCGLPAPPPWRLQEAGVDSVV